jgi:hypothetical protein
VSGGFRHKMLFLGMVLQITKYQTKNTSPYKLSDSLSRLKQFYMNNGCSYYEVFEDCYTDNCILEVKRFDSSETISKLENTPEKKELYDQFCSENNVIEKSDETQFA